MNFTTVIPIAKLNNPICYNSKIVLWGSCFAENIAHKFSYFKFQNSVNPFGIIFNPISIEKLLTRAVHHQEYTSNDVFYHDERWHCFEIHSDLSCSNKEEFLNNLNEILKTTYQQLIKSTHIIITYGTSWVYRNKETGVVVANCHKVPQSKFDKEILSVNVIEKAIQNSIDLLQKINPKCQIIFTISPVRHLKDGCIENQLSKAHLIATIYKIVTSQPSYLYYFPAYEIMMDELRDYRFYDEDMLHPNKTAINYIWQKFTESCISHQTFPIMDEVNTIQKAMRHKPFNPDSESHQKFLKTVSKKIEILQNNYDFINF